MCDTLKLADGTVVIACGRRHRTPPACRFCGVPSTRLCDGPSRIAGKKTCDAPVCNRCARSIGPNRDLCPACAKGMPEQSGLFGGAA